MSGWPDLHSARSVDHHLQQVDQRLRTRDHALPLEQCLTFHRAEVEVLRERIDDLYIRDFRWDPRLHAEELSCQDRKSVV